MYLTRVFDFQGYVNGTTRHCIVGGAYESYTFSRAFSQKTINLAWADYQGTGNEI